MTITFSNCRSNTKSQWSAPMLASPKKTLQSEWGGNRVRQKLRQPGSTAVRLKSIFVHCFIFAWNLLRICTHKAHCAFWTMINHSFLRTCTKRQGKRERDEHRERPNKYIYAMPGREEDWKILSLTFTSLREILKLQEAQKDLTNQMNERESDRIRRTRTGLIKKWWKRSYGHVLKAFFQPTFCFLRFVESRTQRSVGVPPEDPRQHVTYRVASRHQNDFDEVSVSSLCRTFRLHLI